MEGRFSEAIKIAHAIWEQIKDNRKEDETMLK
jgi:hypothetical protein